VPVTFAVFVAALICAAILTPIVRKSALAWGIVDLPDQKLKKHRRPVPYLGGVAIFVAFAFVIVASKILFTGSIRGIVGITAGATMIFLLGLVDDVRPLRPGTKLLFQVLAALIPIYTGVHIKFIDNPIGNIPLTVFWIVGITNAINLLDISDGLAGGIAFIASCCFWTISLITGRFNDALMAAALAGAVLGFLAYNRPPARIFMGDAGSLFLGFSLATIAMGEGYSLKTELGVIAPLLILGVPIFETFFVMALRWHQGKPLMKGSPDHIPLRLMKLGYSQAAMLGILLSSQLLLGLLAIFMVHLNWERVLLIAVGVAIAAFLSAVRLASVKMG